MNDFSGPSANADDFRPTLVALVSGRQGPRIVTDSSPSRAAVLTSTTLALLAFAANSLFCRLALGGAQIDAASFTLVRLLSGALALVVICAAQRKAGRAFWRLDAMSAAALFVYAAPFSFAYRDLTAGTGALLLFGAVQTTMIGTGLFRGERPAPAEWLGLIVAIAGLGWLVLPGLSAPPPRGAALMLLAGVAWGIYSLRGRRTGADPLQRTAANFIWSVPLAALLPLASPETEHFTSKGMVLAILSGALASGVGYAVWYSVLPRLTATRAATVQLTVPVIAALGGALILSEAISSRLLIAAVLVLGGVALAILGRRR
jgi:drug/metabolite transporter (DMT)-like permease